MKSFAAPDAPPFVRPEAYKANFRDPEFLFHMGLNEWKLGKKDKAEGLLRKAVTSGTLTPDEQREAHRVLQKIS